MKVEVISDCKSVSFPYVPTVAPTTVHATNLEMTKANSVKIHASTLEEIYTANVDEAGFDPDGMKFIAFDFIEKYGLGDAFIEYLNKNLSELKEEMSTFGNYYSEII